MSLGTAGGRAGAGGTFYREDGTVAGDAAWVTSTSTTVGSFNGRAVNSTGAELMVLSKDTAGEWRIRAIHWSSHRR